MKLRFALTRGFHATRSCFVTKWRIVIWSTSIRNNASGVVANNSGSQGFGLPQYFNDPKKPVRNSFSIHHDKIYTMGPSLALTGPNLATDTNSSNKNTNIIIKKIFPLKTRFQYSHVDGTQVVKGRVWYIRIIPSYVESQAAGLGAPDLAIYYNKGNVFEFEDV
jgi:hypothetical protein